ncbi:hypothetical protein [Synechocystis sp. PCC 7509]|uniref:hypothetical protein n=1 Tax=Synechocystis sp. PCC 7509 TaxID=927677 RepID=UPI0002ACEF88|nr:hypothetical protein [Synechocystis sp. PCC 7509]
MSEELQQIIPTPPSPIIPETFAAIATTREFYREVQSRDAMNVYCAWYYTTAQKHRQELEQMRGELNILSWFRFRRR